MDEVAITWICIAGGLGYLLGAATGFYAALIEQEQKLRNVNRKLNNL